MAAADLVNQGYLTALLSTNMSQASVDSQLASGFSTYVTKSYVDTQDALNATKTFIDAGDNARLHTADIGANNGIAGLDATGKIASSRIGVVSTQRWFKGFTTPAAYFATPVATVSETTLYTASVADPGFTYKLICFGMVDTLGVTDGTPAQVLVRAGSTSGTVLASGYGCSEAYSYGGAGDTFTRADSSTLGSAWTQQIPTSGLGLGIANNVAIQQVPPTGSAIFRGVSTYNTPVSNDDVRLDLTLGPVDSGGNFGLIIVRLFIGANTSGEGAGLNYTSTGTNSATVHLYSSTDFTGPSAGIDSGNGTAQAQTTTGQIPGTGDVLTLQRTGSVYTALINGAVITGLSSWNDTTPVVPRDSSHRLIGFGIGGFSNSGSALPTTVHSVSSGGSATNGGPATLVPRSLSTQTALTGASTLYVQLASTGSSSVTAGTFMPKLYVMAVPA